MSPSDVAITAYLSTRDRGEADWYLHCEGMSPYQQRQMAQLSTSSDYAVCRGKRGSPEDRLCTCGSGELEDTEHAVLRCQHYAALRGPLHAALRAHVAAIEDEHAYTITAREALRWAIVDECPGLVTPTELTEKSLALYRQALLRFHRMSKQTRYVVVKAVPQRPGAL